MDQTHPIALRAIKHGAYDLGFLPCDRCNSNSSCEQFMPKGRCPIEQKIFSKIVAELTEEFDLDSLADKILVERAAMYMIRILRAEAYDAGKGISEKGSAVGVYIARLDTVLRGLFSDLAVSRSKRKQSERGEALLVSLDEVVKKFAKAETPKPAETTQVLLQSQGHAVRKRFAQSSRRALLDGWQHEYPRLCQQATRGRTSNHGQR
jgi:hypothetical protein